MTKPDKVYLYNENNEETNSQWKLNNNKCLLTTTMNRLKLPGSSSEPLVPSMCAAELLCVLNLGMRNCFALGNVNTGTIGLEQIRHFLHAKLHGISLIHVFHGSVLFELV